MSENGVGVLGLPLLTTAGVGSENIPGTGALSLLLITTVGIGATNSLSNGVATLGLPLMALAGVGSENIPGTGSLALLLIANAGIGSEDIPGTGALSLPLIILAGIGATNSLSDGTATLGLPLMTLAGIGSENIPGTSALSLLLITTAGIGATNSLSNGTAVLGLPLITLAGVGSENIPGTGNLVVLPSGISGLFLKVAGWGWTIATFDGGPGGAGVLELSKSLETNTDLRETSILSMPLWGGDSGATGAGIDLAGPAETYTPAYLIRKIIIDTAGNLAYTTWDGAFHLSATADNEVVEGLIISINTNVHATSPTTAAGIHVFF